MGTGTAANAWAVQAIQIGVDVAMTLDQYFALPGSLHPESPVGRAMLKIVLVYPDLAAEAIHQLAIPLAAKGTILELFSLSTWSPFETASTVVW